MNALDFEDRHAVVTGAAAGIGFAVARRLVNSGARCVTLWDFDEAALAAATAELGSDARAVQVDVSDPDHVQRALDATIATGLPIDALVNSAGITGPNAPLWEYPPDRWKAVHAVNLDGTFHACAAVVRHMLSRSRATGRIVNIASVAGKEGNPNASAYSASKAAVIALTKSLGKELSATGIRVNCVTPAAVRTRLFDQMSAEHISYMLSKIPMGRFGTVEEVASLVSWLCTSECSFTTGAVFDLSGGRATY